MEKLLLFLLQGVPESTGVIALSLALLKVPLRWKNIIGAGTALALIIFLIRELPFSFGIHVAAAIFLLVIAITRATHNTVSKSFIAVLVSYAVLTLLETIIMEVFFAVTGLEPGTAMQENNPAWVLSGLPQAFLMIFFACLIPRLIKPREDAWKI